jgi:hypothetical protein
MIVAMIALFVALGGAAYAGVTLSKNSVRSNTIVNGQVKNVDLATNSVGALKIKTGAVTSVKVRDGALTGADLAPGAVTPSRISGVPSVRAFNSADEAIPSGAFTSVTLNSERFDATAMHRTDIDTSRITIATAGIYLVTGDVTWLTNATGARELNVRKNGTAIVARAVQPADVGGNTSDQSLTTLVQLAAGDYVELVVRQNAGAPVSIATASEFSPEFSAVWVAPS